MFSVSKLLSTFQRTWVDANVIFSPRANNRENVVSVLHNKYFLCQLVLIMYKFTAYSDFLKK